MNKFVVTTESDKGAVSSALETAKVEAVVDQHMTDCYVIDLHPEELPEERKKFSDSENMSFIAQFEEQLRKTFIDFLSDDDRSDEEEVVDAEEVDDEE